jgi:hypothetical protein
VFLHTEKALYVSIWIVHGVLDFCYVCSVTDDGVHLYIMC